MESSNKPGVAGGARRDSVSHLTKESTRVARVPGNLSCSRRRSSGRTSKRPTRVHRMCSLAFTGIQSLGGTLPP
jgi:hypothetical protein